MQVIEKSYTRLTITSLSQKSKKDQCIGRYEIL